MRVNPEMKIYEREKDVVSVVVTTTKNNLVYLYSAIASITPELAEWESALIPDSIIKDPYISHDELATLAKFCESPLHGEYRPKAVRIIVVFDGRFSLDVVDNIRRCINLVFAGKEFKIPVTIKVTYTESDTGLGTAWAQNIGYYLATGEFIANLDGDDECHGARIALQFAALKHHSGEHNRLDIIGSHYHLLGEDAPPEQGHYASRWISCEHPKKISSDYERGVHRLCWGSAMFRASLLDAHGGNTRSVLGAEDFIIAKKYVDAGAKATSLPIELYGYRQHDGQRSRYWHGC